MGIRANLEPNEEPPYPYLGILKNDLSFVVMFNAPNCGIVVFATHNASYKVGYTCREWCEYTFKRYEGTVTLSNR